MQSNESLLLDVTLNWRVKSTAQRPGPFEAFLVENPPKFLYEPVRLLEQLLPIAVERGRRTYSHRRDCRYLGSTGAWGRSGSGGGGENDEGDLVSLCSCGAGKVKGGGGLVSIGGSVAALSGFRAFFFCYAADVFLNVW